MNFRRKFVDLPNLEKSTNPANEFLLHKQQKSGKKKSSFPSPNQKKNLTNPANEFLLHKCKNKNKYMNFRRKFVDLPNLEKSTIQPMSFYYINAETTGKWKNKSTFPSLAESEKKNLQVELTSFS